MPRQCNCFDYFQLEKEEIRLEERKALSRLALHLVLLSQGVPFIHAGQEFYRTKGLEDNTHNLPDSLNQLDWTSPFKMPRRNCFS